MQSESRAGPSWVRAAAIVGSAAAWAAALGAKLLLGFAVKRAAAAYVEHFDAQSGALKSRWVPFLRPRPDRAGAQAIRAASWPQAERGICSWRLCPMLQHLSRVRKPLSI